MEKVSLNPGTMLCPVPAVMVTCGQGDEKNIITIGWTGIINTQPPMTYVSVRKSRHSHAIISKEREFVVNMTTEALAFATDYCGVKSGKDVDKFAEMKLTPVDAEIVKCPMIAESPVNLECKVVDVQEYPTHDMFIAEIVKIHVNQDLFEEDGSIALEKAGLLSYVHGHYFGIKRHPLGKFGYSVMKPKTKKRLNRENHQKRVEANRAKREKKAEKDKKKDKSKKTQKNKSFTPRAMIKTDNTGAIGPRATRKHAKTIK